MKLNLKENRPVACGALAVVVAASLFIGGGNALKARGRTVENVFSAPSESISAELKEMADNAAVMNSIVLNAKNADADKTAAVSAALDALTDADGVSAHYDAAEALTLAVENLYSYATAQLSLSETDAGDFRYKYKNYSSANLRISHDAYNEEAAAFNEEKSGFPAGLISAVRGIADAELFE